MNRAKTASNPKITAKAKVFGTGKAMRSIETLHRWTGGILGVLLAVLGATGVFLLHQTLFLRWTMAHAADPVTRDDARLAALVTHMLGDPAHKLRSLRVAGDGLGVHRAYYTGEGGAYFDQSGQIVTQWSSEWQRPEVWIIDLHRRLFSGDTGEAIVGIAGLIGLGFVITGVLLWWRTRSTFEFRLTPKRLSRPAILRHHRDLGVMVAPFLVLSFVSGAMMALPVVEDVLLAPFGAAQRAKAPKAPTAQVQPPIDWQAVIATARAQVPDGELRYIALPNAREARILIRMRRPGEWTPNGRTMLWFDGKGQLAQWRDSRTLPIRARVKNAEYPLHTGDALPGAGRWIMTISGLGLAMLGSLAVWSFWFRRPSRRG
ncbi:PepSY-associated TM helix domain-containing protein [Novosphingobium sediminicola]|uniref:Putative iron-regulated membrane protein n=1 Tax=Novosphingobium sediminicola TaxID=563162 RepID=A0A7W6CKM8_9SPHN|nr:PepSY-associated TM helix domain-containing protein [Novosphingobium sediminicola]MBB3957210.1 putative iron-regulated membrane protein [Novosphingobium sediminicola]